MWARLGFGLMGLTNPTAPLPPESAIAILKAALEAGATFWNGAEFYGTPDYNSLHLVKDYFTQNPADADKVTLSIKGGMDLQTRQPVGDESRVRGSVDTCVEVLGDKKRLDLYECARVDPHTPIEETMRVLDSYVQAGQLGGISLSEVSAKTIRQAASVTKVAFVEIELSLFATEALSNGVAETCKDLGIPIVAHSPLGRGLLAGRDSSAADLPETDQKRVFPRFQPGNLEKNIESANRIRKVADAQGCAPGQIALAWLRAHSGGPNMPEVLPIPGTTSMSRLKQNLEAVELGDDELKELDEIVRTNHVAGARYPEAFEKYCYA